LEPSPSGGPNDYAMKMREIWARFTKETTIQISLALFGELSVRYVLRSNPRFVGVNRTRGIHDKKYSLRWKNNRSDNYVIAGHDIIDNADQFFLDDKAIFNATEFFRKPRRQAVITY